MKGITTFVFGKNMAVMTQENSADVKAVHQMCRLKGIILIEYISNDYLDVLKLVPTYLITKNMLPVVPPVICLCGSTRFKKAFQEWNARLTLNGNVVYSVAMWNHSKRVEPSPSEKITLDKVHKLKIYLSDSIFVLDVDGYIGESTKSEIEYDKSLGKNVTYLSQEYPNWTENDCQLVQE